MSVLQQSSVPKETVIFSCVMSLSPKGEKQSVSRQASHNQLFPFLTLLGYSGVLLLLLFGFWQGVTFCKLYLCQMLSQATLRQLCIWPPKDMFQNIHSSFISNCPKLGTTQMSISRRLDKQTVIHPYNQTLRSNKEEETMSTGSNTDESHMHSLNENSHLHKYIRYFVIPFMGKYRRDKTNSGRQKSE